jgi:Tfp pilus assembly protein PilN
VVRLDDRTTLLQLADGQLSGVRHFRAGAVDNALIDGAVGNAARGEISGHADAVAAAYAGTGAPPLLQSDDTRALQRERAQRSLRNAVISTAALLVLAAGLELWGVHRELDAVRRERETLRPQIASTLVGRTTVETAYRQLAALAKASQSAPHCSDVITELSQKLPDDAYLTGFRSRGDTVVVDGLAVRASRAFGALEQTTGLTGVRAVAPVRREAPEGAPAMERFTFGARIRRATGGAQ